MTADSMNNVQKSAKTYRFDARAFYLGAHGIDPESVMLEIEARMIQDSTAERQILLRSVRELESRLEQVRREKPEAQAAWTGVRDRLGDTRPAYSQAILLAGFALVAISLDTLFLAPSMDILNISDATLQYIAAAGFAALSTAWFETAGVFYQRGARNRLRQSIAVSAAAAGACCLIAWGLLRGYQLQFAAGLNGNPLGDFLYRHPNLASVFYIFLTLGAPLLGAAALFHAWKDVTDAKLWRTVRTKFEELRAKEVDLARKVQSATEDLEHFDSRQAAIANEWKAVFHQFYDRGRRTGSRKETLASVIAKTALGAALAAPLALFVPFALTAALIVIPTATGVGCFTYFNYRRHHPSHTRYLARENTQFALVPDARRIQQPVQETPRLLTKGGAE